MDTENGKIFIEEDFTFKVPKNTFIDPDDQIVI